MKKFFLSTIMALACVGANAQVETTPVSFGTESVYGIPNAYLYDRDEYMVSVEYDNNNDRFPVKISVYDGNLKLVKEIKTTEGALYFEYKEICEGKREGCYLTQTLFNNDEKFEYMVGIPDDDNTYRYKGIKIMSEDGKVLQTLNLSLGYEFMILRINGNSYLCADETDGENNYKSLYKINKSSDPSKVSIATAPVRINVSPRVAERGQDITVAAEGEGIREVIVTDAAGRVVYRTKADAGQHTVKINSQRLSSGLNVVSVKNADGKSENCKVIVKK